MNRSLPFSLRLTFPVLLLIFSLLIAVFVLTYNGRLVDREVEETARARITDQMNRLQGTLGRLLRLKELEGVQQEISMIGSQRGVYLALLVDDQDRVLSATRFEFTGRSLEEVIERIPSKNQNEYRDQARQVRRTLTGNVFVSRDRQSVIGCYPVLLGVSEGELRPSHVGLLLLQYDLSNLKAAAHLTVKRQVWQLSLFLVTLTVLLGFFFHWVLTRRVSRLVEFTQRLGSGDWSTRTGVGGKDEVGQLGRALERMASRMALDQARLVESEKNFRALTENSHDGVVIGTGNPPRHVYANGRMTEITGYCVEELLRGGPQDILAPDERDRVIDRLKRRLSGEDLPSLYESKLMKKDGSSVPVEISETRTFWQGEPCVIAEIRDIAERKKAEELLRQSEDQLRQAQKMEAVGRLAGGVAHDFNNFLTAIVGYSELLLEGLKPDDPLRRLAGEILRTGERCAAVTRQLLAFSRRQVFQPKVLDPCAVICNVNEILRRLIGEDIDLETVFAPGTGGIRADAVQMEQVLINLAVNARDAMPEGGRLTIKTANATLQETPGSGVTESDFGNHVMIAVSDTGCGMDDETQRRLFEPFFTTKEPGKGTGLGLSTVYGIVQQCGGRILVESVPGEGTTFTILLPRVEGPPDEEEIEVPLTLTSGGTETVLVVEDEETIRALVREILRTNGYNIIEARHGEEAIVLSRKYSGTIHLLLTDVVMPFMTGWDLARRLSSDRPEMKVLFVSGYTDDEIVSRGISREGASFLQKPFTPEALSRKVQEVLSRRE